MVYGLFYVGLIVVFDLICVSCDIVRKVGYIEGQMKQLCWGQVDFFIVMDVMEVVCKVEVVGCCVIYMEVGQFLILVLLVVCQVLVVGLDYLLGYIVVLGFLVLCQGIVVFYWCWYGLDLDFVWVIVILGSSGVFILVFLVLFDVGDCVVLGELGYFSYCQILCVMLIQLVGIFICVEDCYQLCLQDLLQVQGLIFVLFGNFLGIVLCWDELVVLIVCVVELGMSVILDEIYYGLDYGVGFYIVLEVMDDVFVINSFLKYFSMMGWCVGWMVVLFDMICMVEWLVQNMFICLFYVSQVVVLVVLDCIFEVEVNLMVYVENCCLMLECLLQMGFICIVLFEGVFYIYVDVLDLIGDSLVFVVEIFEGVGVVVMLGLDFDLYCGVGMLCFSYVGLMVDIVEGLDCLVVFMVV